MKLEIADHRSVKEVMENLREVDHQEAMAVCPGADADTLASECIKASEYAIVARTDKGEPFAAMGITPATQGTVSLWLMSTDTVRSQIVALTRYLRANLVYKLKTMNVSRAIVASINTHHEAHKWMQILGGKHLCPIPGFGKNGEDFELYEWRI